MGSYSRERAGKLALYGRIWRKEGGGGLVRKKRTAYGDLQEYSHIK